MASQNDGASLTSSGSLLPAAPAHLRVCVTPSDVQDGMVSLASGAVVTVITFSLVAIEVGNILFKNACVQVTSLWEPSPIGALLCSGTPSIYDYFALEPLTVSPSMRDVLGRVAWTESVTARATAGCIFLPNVFPHNAFIWVERRPVQIGVT